MKEKGGKRAHKQPVGLAAYLSAVKADPAGEGQGARTGLKPGEQAGKGGTPSRPSDREPKSE